MPTWLFVEAGVNFPRSHDNGLNESTILIVYLKLDMGEFQSKKHIKLLK